MPATLPPSDSLGTTFGAGLSVLAPTANCSCPGGGTPGADGADGAAGAAGADGTDGVDAYTTTTGFLQPAASANVTIAVANSMWMAIGQVIFIVGGGYYSVVNVISSVSVTINNLGYAGNAVVGTAIANNAKVSPGGIKGADGTNTAVTSTYYYSGDPNTVISALRPAICYGPTGDIWLKTGAGTNATGWEQLVI